MGTGLLDLDALLRAALIGLGGGMCTAALGYFVTKPPVERTRARYVWALAGSGLALLLATVVYYAWPTLIDVPKLDTLSQAEAEDLLVRRKLRSEARPIYSASTEPGKVITGSQEPQPGILVRPGTVVSFAVALRREQAPAAEAKPPARAELRLAAPSTNSRSKLLRSGDGTFRIRVQGATSELATSDQTIALWIRPVSPPSDVLGWYMQRPPASGVFSIREDGTWEGMAQVGNAAYPPRPGHVIDVAATIISRQTYDGLLAEQGVVVRTQPVGNTVAVATDVTLVAESQK